MCLLENLKNLERPFNITALRVSSGLRVLALSPHPDDFDAIGVTMRYFHQNGALLRVAPVRGGSGVEDSFCSPPTSEVKAAVREREQKASVEFFGLPDGQLEFLLLDLDAEEQPLEHQANCDRIVRELSGFSPDAVFLPHYHDTNSGHRRMYRLLKSAAALVEKPMALFLNKDPKTIDIRFDCYTVVDDDAAEWKSQLLRYHDSQQQRNLDLRGYGLDHRLLEDNRDTADKLGLTAQYAEAFEIEFPFHSPSPS